MLSATDIALFQQTAGLTRITPCTISRLTSVDDGVAGQTLTWAPLSTPLCRVYPIVTRGVGEQVGEGRIESVVRWMIALPPGQDVTAKDRIVANGVTYEVSAVLAPRTYELERICQVEVIA